MVATMSTSQIMNLSSVDGGGSTDGINGAALVG
jgi:hypothetical protein